MAPSGTYTHFFIVPLGMNDSMSQNLKSRMWGPHAWKFLHAVTFGYPEKPSPECRKKYAEFFNALATVLPCKVCRGHYGKTIRKDTLRLNSGVFKNRDKLSRWLVRLHNCVNKRYKKPCMTYQEVQKLYASWMVKQRKPPLAPPLPKV